MNLDFNTKLADGYKSNSQIARRLTEDWVLNNSYCPLCENPVLNEFENNRPVADFFCGKCNEEYELKSKSGKLTSTITDGAYSTMIERVNSENNPNFFFLTYSKQWRVENFLAIPKHFFTEDIIVKRPPLKDTARRAGWVGCNINLANVSNIGKIYLVKDSKVLSPKIVSNSFERALFLRKKKEESKGWILDILRYVDSIEEEIFTLDKMYSFEDELKFKHPNNNFIKDKIRQQLQILRDRGIIEFISRGKYKKVSDENI
jgi:type II restriction enzyme